MGSTSEEKAFGNDRGLSTDTAVVQSAISKGST